MRDAFFQLALQSRKNDSLLTVNDSRVFVLNPATNNAAVAIFVSMELLYGFVYFLFSSSSSLYICIVFVS